MSEKTENGVRIGFSSTPDNQPNNEISAFVTALEQAEYQLGRPESASSRIERWKINSALKITSLRIGSGLVTLKGFYDVFQGTANSNLLEMLVGVAEVGVGLFAFDKISEERSSRIKLLNEIHDKTSEFVNNSVKSFISPKP